MTAILRCMTAARIDGADAPSQQPTRSSERTWPAGARCGYSTLHLGATMSDSTIDRRTILSATVAWAAATLSGCSDNGGGSGTGTAGNGGGGGGGGGTGGTGAGGAGGTGGAAPYACMATM